MKKKELSTRVLLSAISAICLPVYGEAPLALIGGRESGGAAYAAFVFSNGTLTPVPSLPSDGDIEAVSINGGGIGLIGGVADSNGFASFVSMDKQFDPLDLPLMSGSVACVAINQNSLGLIGGSGTSGGYAAHVFPDGTVSEISLTDVNFIDPCSLNDSGVGLIGGEGGGGSFFPYAAYVSPEGIASPISGIPETSASRILDVSINDSGNGLIGGFLGFVSYAAFVTPEEPSVSTTLIISEDSSYISSVSMNKSGEGLIGGAIGSLIYAGYATFGDPTVTPLFDTPFEGYLNSVAINSSGFGVIGGAASSNYYAAIRRTDGTIIPLISSPLPGEIYSVAMNDAGIGLIVGSENNTTGYAAIVAPDGTLIPLIFSDILIFNSVEVLGANDAVVPSSVGSYMSPIYTQLAASSALGSRFVQQNRLWRKGGGALTAEGAIFDGEAQVASTDLSAALGSKSIQEKCKAPLPNTIWISPFGDYFNLKKSGSTPALTNEVGGALLGYDYSQNSYMAGASIGYAFNYVHYSESLGHAKVQEEMANIYGGWYQDHFRFNGAIWGGLYQFYNKRHTLSLATSNGKTHGWILAPHLELATPWGIDQKQRYYIEPFVQFDWINSWQQGFTETGSSGLNLEMGSHYGSLLQSEVGLRFYEEFNYGWGALCLEEKLSYVNQAPFHFNSMAASFVAAGSSFPVAIGSPQVENLASAALFGSFSPKNSSYPSGGISLEITANDSYQSYFLNLFCGKEF